MPRVAIVLVCAGLALASSAWAQQAEPRDPSVGGSPDIPLTPPRFNAAMQYHTAWMLLEPVLEIEGMSEVEIQAVQNGKLPESYIGLLEDNQDFIEILIQATKLKSCDFGVNYENGVNAILPQLSVMRQTAHMLRSDAKRLEETDMDAAVERYAATICVGEHAAQTNIVVGSLVGIAIAKMATKEIQRLLDENVLNSGQAELLALALDRVLTDDPFHGLRALEFELMLATWIKYEFQGDDAGDRLIDALGSGYRKGISGKNGEVISVMADQFAKSNEEFIRAWQADDPSSEMLAVDVRIAEGEFGLIAEIATPALCSYYKKHKDAVEVLTKLRIQLRAVPKDEKETDTN